MALVQPGFYVIALALVGQMIAGVVLTCCRTRPSQGAFTIKNVVHVAQALRKIMRYLLFADVRSDSLNQKAARMSDEEVVEAAVRISPSLLICLTLTQAATSGVVAADFASGGSLFPALASILPTLIVADAIVLAFNIWPGLVTRSSIALVHGALMLTCVGQMLLCHFSGDKYFMYDAYFTRFWFTGLRVLLTVLHGDPRSSMWANVPFGFASCFVHGDSCPSELLVISALCLAAISLRQARKDKAVAVLNNRGMLSRMEAMKGILSMVCDVTTTLSKDLTIQGPSPHLATMVMSGHSMQDVDFISLAQDRDSQRLADFLNRDDSIAKCTHVMLKDADSGDVLVRLYHSSIRADGAEPCHLVCLCEEGAADRPRPPGPNDEEPDAIEESIESYAWSEQTMPIESSHEGMAVWVRCEAGFPILRCTPEFVTMIGPAVGGTQLLDWVSNRDEFKAWVESCANELIQEMRLINPIFTVLLTFPHIGHLTRANVDISLEEEPSEGDMLSWIIMVRFQKMERVSCRRRSVSSGSRRRRYRNLWPRDTGINTPRTRLAL